MASLMRPVKHEEDEDVLYPWGVAELTDKWVLLHKHGLPKWAIFYKDKGHTVVVPCHMLKSQKRGVKRRKAVKRKTNT